MITHVPSDRDDILEFHVSGAVTEGDYRNVLLPALDRATAEHDHVRLLVRLDSAPSDFTLGALMEDARVGLKHWRGFDRIAVVTDKGSIRGAVKAMAVFMPCPVMVFPDAEVADAKRWLTESLGSVHQRNLGEGVLHVELLGKLDSAVFAEEAQDLKAFLRSNDRPRLLLDLRQFDGWQGLGAVAGHLSLIREHAPLLDRAAIVGDQAWQRLGERILGGFTGATTRYFKADDFDAAKTWITS